MLRFLQFLYFICGQKFGVELSEEIKVRWTSSDSRIDVSDVNIEFVDAARCWAFHIGDSRHGDCSERPHLSF
jgi:hypothetical protein